MDSRLLAADRYCSRECDGCAKKTGSGAGNGRIAAMAQRRRVAQHAHLYALLLVRMQMGK